MKHTTLPTSGVLKKIEGGLSVFKVYFRGVFITQRGSREDAESVLAHYCKKLKARAA